MNIDLYHRVDSDTQRLWDIENYQTWGRPSVAQEILEPLRAHLAASLECCLRHNTRVIGLGCTYSNVRLILWLARELKSRRPDLKIVVGGPGTNSQASRRMICESGDVDATITGEGEAPLAAYLASLDDEARIPEFPGLNPCRESDPSLFMPPQHTLDLDDFPFPDYFGLDLREYAERSLPIVFSRGCRGNCSFCEISLLWNTYRARSPSAVLSELEHHIHKLNIKKFRNFDSAINQEPARLTAIVNGINKQRWGRNIEWDGSFIVRLRHDMEFFSHLRRAGCKTLYFGVESGSDTVLKLMKKPFTSSQASANIRHAANAGIEVFVNIIVGFPGESESDFQRTLDFIRSHRRWISRVGAVTTLQLVEGTSLHRNAAQYGIVVPERAFNVNWRTQDGTNTPESRLQRQHRLLELLESIGLDPPCCASLHDEINLPTADPLM